MSRIPGINANFSWDGLDIEDELNSIAMSVDPTLTEVTAFADLGAEFVEGLMNAKFSLAGACDFAANQGDSKIFGAIGAGEKAHIFQPTGAGAGASDPNYTGNSFVSNYTITCVSGGAATYTCDLQVNGPVVRSV